MPALLVPIDRSAAATRVLACVDVAYGSDWAVAACVGFTRWDDATPALERTVRVMGPAATYEPGQLYRRELPHILQVLRGLAELPAVVIVDGYVWLGPERPGLGAHLYQALEQVAAVVGVAKTPFRGADAVPVLRGRSRRPLLVSAAGIDVAEAAARVAAMHGAYRIPTLLRRVDRLSRGLEHPEERPP